MNGDIFVGTTGNDIETQWQKILTAAELDLDYPLYRQIRCHGAEHFLVEEWDCADNRRELNQLEDDAIKTLNAQSLRGYKTAKNKSRVQATGKKPTSSKLQAMEKELAHLIFGNQADTFSDPDESLFAEPAASPAPKGRLIKASQLEPSTPVIAESAPTRQTAHTTEKPTAVATPEAKCLVEPSESTNNHSKAETEIKIPVLRPWQKPTLSADDADLDALLAEISNLQADDATEADIEEAVAPTTQTDCAPVTAEPSTPEEKRLACIRKAVEAQRAALAARTQSIINDERAALAELLTQFNMKAAQLKSTTTCLH